MSRQRNTFPNGSKVIPIRFDPVAEAIAKQEAARIGKSISFYINKLVAEDGNKREGYIISSTFLIEEEQ